MAKPKTSKQKEAEQKEQEREAMLNRPHFTRRIIKKGDIHGTSNTHR